MLPKQAEVAAMPMTKAEAQRAVETIRGNLDSAGRLALDLRRRGGWKALGYSSWAACTAAEFGESQRRLQQLMAAEEVRSFITNHGSQELIDSIPERTMRPLTSLRDEPEKIQEAWELANEQTNGKPTGRTVQAAVDAVLERHSPAVKPGQTTFLDEEEEERPESTPEEVADLAAQAWLRSFNDNLRFFISVKRQGGAIQLTREWSRARRDRFVAAVEEFISLANSIVDELKERT
jgi:hypothetical protein